MAIFFTYGVSLTTWNEQGMLAREVKFYEKLSIHVGKLWFFTYGIDDAKFQKRLHGNIKIFPKPRYIPNPLYALVLPLIFHKHLRRVRCIRIHQMAGAIPALVACLFFRKPLIVRAGFHWLSCATKENASIQKRLMIALLEYLTYRTASLIIHTTREDANTVCKTYHIPRSRIFVIPNYVDTDLFKPLSVQKRPRSICTIARLEPQKNLSMLIAALKGLHATLIIYGDGSLKQHLQAQATTLGVSVEFHARIDHESLPQALNQCELFILPSRYEGHPKALLEAMACGLPVIGTRVPGIESVIDDEKTGVLCDANPMSIHVTIKKLLMDKKKQQTLGGHAREEVQTNYRLDQVVQLERTIDLTL